MDSEGGLAVTGGRCEIRAHEPNVQRAADPLGKPFFDDALTGTEGLQSAIRESEQLLGFDRAIPSLGSASGD